MEQLAQRRKHFEEGPCAFVSFNTTHYFLEESNVSYSNYDQLETDFAENKLHPGDLKQTVGNYLVKVISPIREKLNLSEELSETIKKSF